MADGRHIENRFLALSQRHLCKFWNGDEESQADIGHLTKVAIFANSRWRRAAILKVALYPYLSRNYPISSKFGMPIQISIPRMARYLTKKSKFFKFKMADGRHVENRFMAISRRLIGRLTRNSERR